MVDKSINHSESSNTFSKRMFIVKVDKTISVSCYTIVRYTLDPHAFVPSYDMHGK